METPVAGGFTKRFDIPLSHLDFEYVKNCSDVKELEKILKVLKSNEEGYFPDLERCCEDRLTDLSPNSRVLRKDKPVATKSELDKDEREELDNDIKNWTSNMKNMESGLTPTSLTEDDTELPPIRSGSITLTAEGAKSSTTTATNKRVMPREYRDWDKIDIDKELEKVDEQGDKAVKEKTVVGNKEVKNIPDHVNVTGMSEHEKLLKANREKDKGNEAFKAGDVKEAISYYSRSISLLPTAASYNNRALAYLKHEDWQKALADTNTVMKMEPSNIKALLRRGSAYKGLKQYGKAKTDLKSVLDLEPKNKKAQDMMDEIEKIEQKEKEERKTKGRRMVIQDVDGTEYEPAEEEKPKLSEPSIEKKQPRRMQIQEVESEEEEDKEEEDNVKEGKDVTYPLLNGHASPSEKQGAESVINNSHNKDEQIVDGGNITATKAETETGLKSGVIDNLSNVSDGQKNIDTIATAKTSALESKLAEDRSEHIHINEANVDSKVIEELKQVHVEDSPAEQTQSNTVIDNDTDELVAKDDKSQEGGDSDKVNDSHVFKRPVFYKLKFPENCVSLREEANTCFKNGQFGDGCEKYAKLINILETVPDQIVNLSLMYSNRAACHLKTGDLPSVVKDCTKSLELVPHSFKPLLRRAMAFEHLERYDKAYVDYRHILMIDHTVHQAYQGTQRCQDVLSKKDGPKWRERVQLKQVSQWEIPEIQDISEKHTPQEEKKPGTVTDKPKQAETEVIKEIKEEAPEEEVLTMQEKFEKVKAQGNLFVQEGKFKEAVEYYTECSAILPDETVSYTNRALCYIRLNQADKAELDCTRVLGVDPDNVKALFRRAQARKMLQKYSDGIKDLKHLLEIEPKNGPAKKEMELMKNYWREQLQNIKKDMPAADTGGKTSTGKSSDGKNKPQPVKKDSKSRKRVVIEEVESDEETPPTKDKDSKGKKLDEKSPLSNKTKAKIEEIQKQLSKTVESLKQDGIEAQSKQTNKSDSKSAKSSKSSSKKTEIKETSSGLPRVPKSVPKLEKATPYEFISAWNSLKKSDSVKPYYELLKQINPEDLTTVISNKLDGSMLNTIVRCVLEHFLKDDNIDTSFQLMHNLSKVPRFGTVSMFMTTKEKSDVLKVMEKLADHKSSLYTATDIQKLRLAYSV